MQYAKVLVDSPFARVSPDIMGYVGGYYQWDNNWKFTGRFGVQSFGGAQLLNLTPFPAVHPADRAVRPRPHGRRRQPPVRRHRANRVDAQALLPTDASNPALYKQELERVQRVLSRSRRKPRFAHPGEDIMAPHDAARALKGKVALVTGAGRGLGRAFAERLASLGADVAIHGMRENGPAEYGEGSTLTAVAAEVAAAHGVRTIRVLGDLTAGADIARVIETATKQFGPIDILVHNAGGDIAAKGGKPDPNDAVGIREEDVRAVLDRNLLSTILTCQAVAKEMMPRRQGRIVTIGSVAAFKGRTNGSIYAVAKAGMTHYTRCLADQLRSYDITVNCIAPGDTRTGRFMGTRAVDQNRMVEAGTLDRIATVDEVARVVEVFAGPLGAFVSGQVLRVDGGGQCWAG